jgi:hypothetical protein
MKNIGLTILVSSFLVMGTQTFAGELITFCGVPHSITSEKHGIFDGEGKKVTDALYILANVKRDDGTDTSIPIYSNGWGNGADAGTLVENIQMAAKAIVDESRFCFSRDTRNSAGAYYKYWVKK